MTLPDGREYHEIQFTGTNADDVIAFADALVAITDDDGVALRMILMNGSMFVPRGGFVVKLDGELHACAAEDIPARPIAGEIALTAASSSKGNDHD